MIKECITCGSSENGFYNDKNLKDGLSSVCKKCQTETNLRYRRTKIGMITKMYNHQKQAPRRNIKPPTYSKSDLIDWCMCQPKFHILYDNWKRLDYQSDYKPSVDRVDDYLGYTMSNIQLMTWGENKAKAQADIKSGKNMKKSKPVYQLTLDGEIIAEYHSIREAERNVVVSSAGISQCCKGITTQSGGYNWEYK